MFALVGRYHATSTYSTSPPEDIKRPMMNTMVLVSVRREIESWDDKVYHLEDISIEVEDEINDADDV